MQLPLEVNHCPGMPSVVSRGKRALSRADPAEDSISRSTGPDDGFFHTAALSHK